MSDDEIRAAQRRWRANPTPETAYEWAKLYDRTVDLGQNVSVAFGVKDKKGKRVVGCVTKVMSLLHGSDHVGALPISEVARTSKRQWREIGFCGDATITEIQRVLEANGLTISENDDPRLEALRDAVADRSESLESLLAEERQISSSLRDQRDNARRELNSLHAEVARLRSEVSNAVSSRNLLLHEMNRVDAKLRGVVSMVAERTGVRWVDGLPPTNVLPPTGDDA